MRKDREKFQFFFRHLARGLLWLGILIGGFILFKKYVSIDYLDWLKPVYQRPVIVYLIYTASEIFFGIIPPEIFIMWSLRSGVVRIYMQHVLLLSLISYGAGVLGFLIGRYLKHTQFFVLFKKKIFGKYEKYLYRFGAFIIIVASVTPLPFSGVSMLIGSVAFPFKKFLLFALSRFLRFLVYSFVIWEVNML